LATLVTSFDVSISAGQAIDLYGVGSGLLEIAGTEGTLSMPDPNMFDGPVRVRRLGEKEWSEFPLSHGYVENSRGLGVADMATAMRSGRPHRADGALALHVLDTMQAVLDASAQGHHIELESTCERPAPVPAGLPEHQLDD
jgi:predicted dehydrogenase